MIVGVVFSLLGGGRVVGSGWVSYPTLLSCLLYKQLLNLLNLIEVTLGEVITRLPTQSDITQHWLVAN